MLDSKKIIFKLLESSSNLPIYLGGKIHVLKYKGLINWIGYSSYFRDEIFSIFTKIQSNFIQTKLINLTDWYCYGFTNLIIPKYISYKSVNNCNYLFEDKYSLLSDGYLYHIHNDMNMLQNRFGIFFDCSFDICNNGVRYLYYWNAIYRLFMFKNSHFLLDKKWEFLKNAVFIYNSRKIYFSVNKTKFIFDYELFFKKKFIIKNKFFYYYIWIYL